MPRYAIPLQSLRGRAGTTAPSWVANAGTTVPSDGWLFGDASDAYVFGQLHSFGYTSGNPSLRLLWRCQSGGATSGNVVWGASIYAYTPDTDSASLLAKALATEQTVTDGHLGTNAARLHTATISISNLDSLAANDYVMLRVGRLGSNGGDTLSGNAVLCGLDLDYS